MFKKFTDVVARPIGSTLDIENNNIFNELEKSCDFEDITVGRKGQTLVDYKNELIPLVRTTTIYNKSVQSFSQIHYNIINQIKNTIKDNNLEFNNALIEIYTNEYHKMKYHSDQSLDLDNNSYICLFTCYENNSNDNIRKLIIKNKTTNESSYLSLDNNSIIIFSIEKNKNYLHKIILDNIKSNNRWLGITFRLSKTFIKFINEIPYFYPNMNKILRLANSEEKITFYSCRSKENLTNNYIYPEIDYTISISDILQIKI